MTNNLDWMLQNGGRWTLADDNKLAANLRQLSASSLNKLDETHARIRKLSDRCDRLCVRANGFTSGLDALGAEKFVENRIYDEDETEQRNLTAAAEKSQKIPSSDATSSGATVEERTKKRLQAIARTGSTFLSTNYHRVDIKASDFDEQDDPTFRPAPIFEAFDPYVSRPLPAIIGSHQFYYSSSVLPHSEEDFDENIDTNKHATTDTVIVSLADEPSPERQHPPTERAVPFGYLPSAQAVAPSAAPSSVQSKAPSDSSSGLFSHQNEDVGSKKSPSPNLVEPQNRGNSKTANVQGGHQPVHVGGAVRADHDESDDNDDDLFAPIMVRDEGFDQAADIADRFVVPGAISSPPPLKQPSTEPKIESVIPKVPAMPGTSALHAELAAKLAGKMPKAGSRDEYVTPKTKEPAVQKQPAELAPKSVQKAPLADSIFRSESSDEDDLFAPVASVQKHPASERPQLEKSHIPSEKVLNVTSSDPILSADEGDDEDIFSASVFKRPPNLFASARQSNNSEKESVQKKVPVGNVGGRGLFTDSDSEGDDIFASVSREAPPPLSKVTSPTAVPVPKNKPDQNDKTDKTSVSDNNVSKSTPSEKRIESIQRTVQVTPTEEPISKVGGVSQISEASTSKHTLLGSETKNRAKPASGRRPPSLQKGKIDAFCDDNLSAQNSPSANQSPISGDDKIQNDIGGVENGKVPGGSSTVGVIVPVPQNSAAKTANGVQQRSKKIDAKKSLFDDSDSDDIFS